MDEKKEIIEREISVVNFYWKTQTWKTTLLEHIRCNKQCMKLDEVIKDQAESSTFISLLWELVIARQDVDTIFICSEERLSIDDFYYWTANHSLKFNVKSFWLTQEK